MYKNCYLGWLIRSVLFLLFVNQPTRVIVTNGLIAPKIGVSNNESFANLEFKDSYTANFESIIKRRFNITTTTPRPTTISTGGLSADLASQVNLIKRNAANANHSSIEDPMKTRREPKWMDACNKRPQFNETLINIIVGPQTHHPSHAIEEDLQRRGQFMWIKARKESSSESGVAMERDKRSVAISGADRYANSAPKWLTLVQGNQDLNIESGLLSAKSKISSENPSKNLGYKKTSFKYSKAKTRYLQSLPDSMNLNSHLSSASATNKDHSLANAIKLFHQNGAVADKLIDGIFASDIKLSWNINCALNSAASVKRLLVNVAKMISDDMGGKVVDLDRRQVLEKQRKWLPKLEDLLHKDQLRKDLEPQVILANINHYIQFFSVAFEQMVYEQTNLERKSAFIYKDLERSALKILCDAEGLIKLVDFFNAHRRALDRLIGHLGNVAFGSANVPELRESAREIARRNKLVAVQAIERRIRYNREALESPYSKQHNEDRITVNNSSFVSRDVMPISQRILGSNLERNTRDLSIVVDFEKLIDFYMSVLTNIYI